MSDSRDECRAIDFEREYEEWYGCTSDEDESYDDVKEVRIRDTRRRLGWDR